MCETVATVRICTYVHGITRIQGVLFLIQAINSNNYNFCVHSCVVYVCRLVAS